MARNIVSTDDEWEFCLNEACTNQFSKAICSLFAYICIFHLPLNARFLYIKFKKHFYHPSMSDEIGEVFALNNIDKIIVVHGLCLNDF